MRQRPDGTDHVFFDGAFGNAGPLGHLGMGQALEPVQQKDRAGFVRQGVENGHGGGDLLFRVQLARRVQRSERGEAVAGTGGVRLAPGILALRASRAAGDAMAAGSYLD